MKKILMIFILLFFIFGCSGKYCIKTNVEKYGVEGEICYDSISSKIEGTVVFEDKEGNQIFGINKRDIDTIIELIEKGKNVWDKSKKMFGLKAKEKKKKKYKRLKFYLEKFRKSKK